MAKARSGEKPQGESIRDPRVVFFSHKARDLIGKGRRGGEQEGKGTQEDCSATWLKVFGFKVMGLVSGSEPVFLKVLMKRQGLKKTPHPLTKPTEI